MKQYLHVEHSAKIQIEATPADEIAGTLYKYIPPDYTTSEEAFEATVEKDAVEFKPMGTRLSAYLPAKGKGKGKAKGKATNGVEVEVTDDDEVAYEFYHVRAEGDVADGSLHGLRRGSESIIAGCSCLYCSLSKGVAISR